MAKIGFISLGCPKNLVDSEVMLGFLEREGHTLTANPAEADVIDPLDQAPPHCYKCPCTLAGWRGEDRGSVGGQASADYIEQKERGSYSE